MRRRRRRKSEEPKRPQAEARGRQGEPRAGGCACGEARGRGGSSPPLPRGQARVPPGRRPTQHHADHVQRHEGQPRPVKHAGGSPGTGSSSGGDSSGPRGGSASAAPEQMAPAPPPPAAASRTALLTRPLRL